MEGAGFDLLTMGRPEGQGCYCYINNILRTFLDMAMDDYEYVVIDNEAGMEHLSRRTTKRMDALLLVSDPTSLGVRTAMRISNLADEMEVKVGRRVLLVNRTNVISTALADLIKGGGFDEVLTLPEDASVMHLAIEGRALTESPRDGALYQRILGLARSLC